MTVIRRVYLYLLTFTGLALLAVSVANLGRVALEILGGAAPATGANPERYVREEVARWAAGSIIGLPVWALHWWWAQRLAANEDERASTLRRLFVYAVLTGATLVAAAHLHLLLEGAFAWIDGTPSDRVDVLRAIPFLVVSAVVWAYHWRIAVRDRALVGEHGGSATLRRWFVYAPAFVGWLMLLNGARSTVETLWLTVVAEQRSGVSAITDPLPLLLTGLALWLWQWVWVSRRLAAQGGVVEAEAAAGGALPPVLRSVYLFLTLAVVVAGTLAGASQLLYYGLARALGVESPGGVRGNLAVAAAGPASLLLVFGIGWLYARQAIRQEARAAQPGGSALHPGLRRIYTYLIALLALAALASGVGGLLWTFGDLLTGALDQRGWRDDVARFATLAIVGLPVWITHWTPSSRVPAEEARALMRRLYEFLALIAAMLALVFSLVSAVYLPLSVLLGAAPDKALATDLAHAVAAALVGAVVAGYHWLAIRADSALAAQAAPAPAAAPAPTMREVLLRVRLAADQAPPEALAALRERGYEAELAEGS